VLLAAVAVTGNGLLTSAVHAQGIGADPATNATPAADRFRLPAVADLATDATRGVVDIPQVPGDEVDLTPVIEGAQEALDALPAEDWDVPALAATLADPVAAFELVRDGIAFDAYPGLLRGAQGTLAARAGNSFDRAALLKALIDTQGATTRFAFGTLDQTMAGSLVTRSFEGPGAPLAQATGSPFDDVFETAIDSRARRDNALLTAALGDRLAGLAADASDAAATDLIDHAWVQVQQADGSWLDLDPTMPDARPGDTITTPMTTADTVPDASVHTVGLRLVSEMLQAGALTETPVLDITVPAWAVAGQQLLVTFTAASGGGLLGGPGGLLGGGGGGTPSAWVPTLLIDDKAWQGEQVILAGEVGGGGLLGPGEKVDLVSLALDLTTNVPGAQPTVTRHVIADRLTAEQRASGATTAADLAPVADDAGTPAVFRSVLHLMVSTGGSDPRTYAADQLLAAQMAAWAANAPDTGAVPFDQAFAPAAISDRAMVVASEQRFIPALDDADVRAFVASPRLYLASRALDPVDPGLGIMTTDIVTDGIRTLARDGASDDAAARRQLWYGALQGALETEYGLTGAGSVAPDGRTLVGVSLAMGQPLSTLDGADESLPAASDHGLEAILDAGGFAVVPGDVAAARTWWEVGSDGTTRAVLAPRMGGWWSSWVRRFSPAYRVQPSSGSYPGGGQQNRPGTEYQQGLGVSEQATPGAQVQAEISKDAFEGTAHALKSAARKKIIGG
jgi:hypothetical protein